MLYTLQLPFFAECTWRSFPLGAQLCMVFFFNNGIAFLPKEACALFTHPPLQDVGVTSCLGITPEAESQPFPISNTLFPSPASKFHTAKILLIFQRPALGVALYGFPFRNYPQLTAL